MKILLFGASGQVGSECALQFLQCGWEVFAITRAQCDFSQDADVANTVMTLKPDFVVNACAYTAVDKAEEESDLAYKVNATSVKAMAGACAKLGIPTLHISTDYVFDGNATAPYTELDTVAPTGVYGKTKLAGETYLVSENPDHIILRTSWVFGITGNNFVKTMLRLAAEKDELAVVADQRGCPTYAADIAWLIAKLMVKFEKEGELDWGVYHCSNAGVCSWHEFAQAIFSTGVQTKAISKVPRLNPISTDQYPTAAKRPAYSVLDNSKLEQLLGSKMPHWQQGLAAVCSSVNRV